MSLGFWEGRTDGVRSKIRLSRWEANRWTMYGECFQCGEFLEWAEKRPKSFIVVITKEKENDDMVDVKSSYSMTFKGVE